MKKNFPSRFFRAVKSFAILHKFVSVLIIIAVLGGGYAAYASYAKSKLNQTRYVTAAVEKGAIVVSVSGTGQVSASNQVDIKPKVSGDVISVNVTDGQALKKGALIAQLDTQDAQKSVRDARANLESARLSLEKLKAPADTLTLLQAENALSSAKQSKENAESNLVKGYDDGFNAVSNAFLDLPNVMSGLEGVLYGKDVGTSGQANIDAYFNIITTYRNDAPQLRSAVTQNYTVARAAYEKAFQDYRAASRSSDHATVEALIDETYDTAKLVSDAIKNSKNFLDIVDDVITVYNRTRPSALAGHKNSLDSYTGSTNSHLGGLLNIKNTIKTNKDALVNADRSIAEKTESLAKLKAGPDALDIRSQEISIEQRQNALTDALQNLSDYSIRAPFDGIIAKLSVKRGDAASPSTAIATFITVQQIAEISLNEVDVAKVKVGQKATLTFDAVSDLTVSGEVASVDALGTVSQGVVSYAVKIAFDTQESQVKPGMSVSAAIVTDIKQDVLVVPLSAVKTQGNISSVDVVEEEISSLEGNQGVILKNPPASRAVETGLSNDTNMEIVSGLSEGDIIVVRTVAPSATVQTNSTPSLFGGGGGGSFRAR